MEEFKVPSVSCLPRHSKLPKSKDPEEDRSTNEMSGSLFQRPEDRDTENTFQQSKCPYIEPKWSRLPDSSVNYRFEVLKSGAIVHVFEKLQSKSFWGFGRLPDNHIVMAHPTVSRYHCVLQYRSEINETASSDENTTNSKFGKGWYLYDLGSTHGSFINKQRIPPKTYVPVKVGHMIKLGTSSRNFILQGPDSDTEPESDLSVTELKEQRKQEEEAKRKLAEKQAIEREKEGISWGMSEDADEETDLSVNPYASTNNEELFLDDPKKTLRGFFERDGLDLDYKVDEMSAGTFVCRIELPVDDANGKPIVAEICHKGKKKDCVFQCALEACRILDRHGVLRQSHHEPLKRRGPLVDSDDDDDFLDRTGDVERKKMRKMAGQQNNALTYQDLLKQEDELLEKMSDVQENIDKYHMLAEKCKNSEVKDDDDLDTFMTNLCSDKDKFDKVEIRKLRVEEQRLKTEHQKLQRLINIAKPLNLPPIKIGGSSTLEEKKKSFFPLFGKRSNLKVNKPVKTPATKVKQAELNSDEEEEEEKEENGRLTSSESIENKVEKQDLSDRKSDQPNSKVRILGPAFIPPEILEKLTNEGTENAQETVHNNSNSHSSPDNSENDATSQQNSHAMETTSENSENANSSESTLSKKRKSRVRNRNDKPRENVDIDDSIEFIEPAKYSTWVPPQDQKGDGFTSLNEKFGY